VPGEEPHPFQGTEEARGILNDAEAELRDWTPSWESHTTEGAQGETYREGGLVEGQSNVATDYAEAGSSTVGHSASAHDGHNEEKVYA